MKPFYLIIIFFCWALQQSWAQRRSFYFTTSDSVRLYVEVVGKGQPCVFVHGGPGSTSHYLQATGAAPLLEEKLEMIYYDQRGSGRSASPANHDYSLRRMLQDLEEIRRYLGYNKWSVMGHSFAGTLVTPYAERFPQSVQRLLLVHCTLDLNASVLSHIRFGVQELQLADSAALLYGNAPLMERLGQVHDTLFKAKRWYKLMFRSQYEKDVNDTLDHAIVPFNRDFAQNVWNIADYFDDFTQRTPFIRCPVLVITGSRDYAIGPEQYLRFRFPHAKTVVYRGGHASFQEEPQWFTEQIFRFFKLQF
ncbi:MAG: alpha/beta fold hydrolase [Lacibacter sp.]